MTTGGERRPLRFSTGLVAGLWIPVLSGVAMYLMDAPRHWVGVVSLVEVAVVLGVVATAPRWRRFTSGLLAGMLTFPAFGILLLAAASIAQG